MLRRLGLLCALGVGACAPARLVRFEYASPHMGTEFRIVLFAPDSRQAEVAAGAAFERVAELERILSDYDAESELSRVCAHSDAGAPSEWLPVSEPLYTVLEAAQVLARASGGAFDATAGPYVRLWRRARRQEELPAPAHVAAAAPAVGHAKLELGPARTVRFLAPGMRLDLGGLGKGFALDQAFLVLREHGFERALLVGGGELLAGAPPPGRTGWRVELVGLDSTPEELELAHCALATSGDLERYVELAGRRYSHILDPRTGRALSESRLASVLAPGAMQADALATALSVLAPQAGLALVEDQLGVAARVLVRRAGRTLVFRSAAFPPTLSCLERPASSP